MPPDRAIGLWGGAATLALLAASAAGADKARAPDAERLTHLVIQECGSCHGLTLRGGLGEPLTAEHLEPLDRETIAFVILNGIPGTPMPPWRELLSEAEAEWIADMLKRGALQ